MPQWLKFLAFVLCVAWVVMIFKHNVLFGSDQGPIHLDHGHPVVTKPSTARRVIAPLLMIGMWVGPVILAIDAYRREYDEPKVFPIVLATMGLFSLGITSIIYYLAWGNAPTKLYRSAAEMFCDQCIASTLDIPARGLGTVRHIMGVRLIGITGRCETCGSIVKTRWFWLIVPLIPFGSFRVLRAGDPSLLQAALLTRKLPQMDWVQVAARYVFITLLAGAVAAIVYL